LANHPTKFLEFLLKGLHLNLKFHIGGIAGTIMPMRRMPSACCARATRDNIATAPVKTPRNSRRLMSASSSCALVRDQPSYRGKAMLGKGHLMSALGH
jgi:hypothetical protein